VRAAAAAETENQKPKDYPTRRRNGWRNCGWSETRQQHSNGTQSERR